MKTEDIDKKIDMPDVDAEWEKFEREVIDKEFTSNKSVIMWGLSIAASIALVAGIFLLGNASKEQAGSTVAKVEQSTASKSHKEVSTTSGTERTSEAKTVSETKTTLETKTVSETVQQPVEELLAKATPSGTEEKADDNGSKAIEEPVKQETIFSVVEQSPSFPGGNRALEEFIKTNQQYPDLAMEYGAKGKVIMTILVDSLGYVSDIKVHGYKLKYDTLRLSQETAEKQKQVKEQIALQLGEESTRILSLMPRWSPGKVNGKALSVKYNVPIQFQTSEAERQTFLAQKQHTGVEAALQTRIAGLDIVPTSADMGTNFIRLRGSRNGNDSILILVNGTPLPDSLNNISTVCTRLMVYLYKKGQSIHGIYVYKDEKSIKQQYGERAKNGVISFTTTPDTLCDAYIREHPELKQSRRYVEGYVMNEKGEPLADAWVSMTTLSGGAATDTKGHFALWLPLTQKELLANCTGYESSRQKVDPANPMLIFHLKEPIVLKDVKNTPRGKNEAEGEAIPVKKIRIR